ncbi:MAG: N-acetylglucosamine-6-phosphate deacetylase [Ignavibacteriales bacterium]|nr:N-acetylglucosamine-6-phosphate deacetylase [Ignavibacteriales bacterium]
MIIKNCRHYKHPDDGLWDIHVDGDIITAIRPAGDHDEGMTLDARGAIASPGLIDVHIQGAGGSDVMDATPEALRCISSTLVRYGTTAFLGTTFMNASPDNAHLRLLNEMTGSELGGARLLGIHMEGPFINLRKKGGIHPASIFDGSAAALEKILELTGTSLKMMTIAPELPGNLDLIRRLLALRIIPSFGHSEATYLETKAAFETGVSHVTHLFNAMPPLTHRSPGPLTAIFESNHVSAQIISDGQHLDPAIVALAYKFLGPMRTICITDGIQGIGLPPGHYMFHGREYETENGAARYLDGTLIGASIGLSEIVALFRRFTGCSLGEAIDSASLAPARLLGIDNRCGSLEVGKSADVVLFDGELRVQATLVGGRLVYHAL